MAKSRSKPKVFVDADVIFAGAAAPTEHGASHVVLRMGEITLLDCISSEQAVKEVERNLAEKIPEKLPDFNLLVSRSLRIVNDPQPEELASYKQQADPKDLPILVAALKEGCSYLLTFNVWHFTPTTPGIIVQQPSGFLMTVRSLLGMLKD
ncbi:MAG: PIN domain-containing protein [Desulfobacterales bacterium]|jgi:predicted nucleic acid-binding protein